jgi:hypothetical protein
MPDKSIHRGPALQAESSAEMPEALARLDGLLRRALIALGHVGESDCACRLAAEAWSVLRRDRPGEAERYTALLHRLTATKHAQRRHPT